MTDEEINVGARNAKNMNPYGIMVKEGLGGDYIADDAVCELMVIAFGIGARWMEDETEAELNTLKRHNKFKAGYIKAMSDHVRILTDALKDVKEFSTDEELNEWLFDQYSFESRKDIVIEQKHLTDLEQTVLNKTYEKSLRNERRTKK